MHTTIPLSVTPVALSLCPLLAVVVRFTLSISLYLFPSVRVVCLPHGPDVVPRLTEAWGPTCKAPK